MAETTRAAPALKLPPAAEMPAGAYLTPDGRPNVTSARVTLAGPGAEGLIRRLEAQEARAAGRSSG